MIIDRMLALTHDIQFRVKQEERRLEAIASIRKILSDIDFSSEVIPCDDSDRLTKTLESLKGDMLGQDEKNVVNEIVCQKVN